MSIYKCSVCGFEFDEKTTNKKFEDLTECPICNQKPEVFKLIKEEKITISSRSLDYDEQTLRVDPDIRFMDDIHKMAVTGKSIHAAMATEMPMPNFDDILIVANQLNPMPLESDDEVNTTTIIGKNAKKPMVIENPVFISHMSFGALSYETKMSLSKGSALAKTAMAGGEGGILPDEQKNSYKYIFEYVPNHYSLTKENLKNADAIEIKIGQGTKPGMGGHLPGDKVTKEIAELRGKKEGEEVISPSRFSEIQSKEDLKELVSKLRAESDGRPIGVKIAAGKLERDLEYCVYSECDFITIDGRGGATGSSPKIIRDATSIPTVFALYRARKYLDECNAKQDLIITGGLRVSSDFAKALAMGADAIAVASAALIAAACQQYKVCGTGMCPVGVATQDEELRRKLNVESASLRVANYLNVSKEEIKTFARICGHSDVHDLNNEDLTTFNREISEFTNIKHV